jgi:hypothetical protein
MYQVYISSMKWGMRHGTVNFWAANISLLLILVTLLPFAPDMHTLCAAAHDVGQEQHSCHETAPAETGQAGSCSCPACTDDNHCERCICRLPVNPVSAPAKSVVEIRSFSVSAVVHSAFQSILTFRNDSFLTNDSSCFRVPFTSLMWPTIKLSC